jgi:phosphatidylethanolamine/phosphatidyl-N-methylethanolamine N-methyltransferase
MRSGPLDQFAVDAVYRRLAPLYDVLYGAVLNHGRRSATVRLAPRPGESILEVGVGTGLSALRYPRLCRVVAIDVSEPMLRRARVRLARHGCRNVRLCRMDAGRLAFADDRFDAVYAPYLLNVVPDPIAVVREMARVCRPDGRLVLLNHFDHKTHRPRFWMRAAGDLAVRISRADWSLDLERVLAAADLVALSIEPVNLPPVSSVVVCRRKNSARDRTIMFERPDDRASAAQT